MLYRIQRLLRNQRFRKAYCWSALGQLLLINVFLFGFTLYADDCERDWRRAEDCLRTPGFAQTIGTGAGVIATILINGAAIQTILLTPPQEGEDGEGGEGQPPRQYYFDVRTQGGRTSLAADGQDSLWVYGEVRCTDPKIDCSGLTGGISFSPGGTNWDWLQTGGSDYSGGMKAAQFTAVAPAGAAGPGSASIVVSTSVEGQSLVAEVPITLSTLTGDWEVTTEPADPGELVPDTNQVITLNARIKFDPSTFAPDVAQQLLQETQDNMKFTAGQWLDLSDPPTPMGEGFMAVNVAASDPSGEPMRSARPESETITISTMFNGQEMQTSYSVKIAQRPELEVKPDAVSILGGAGDSFDIKAWITAPGPNSWTITSKFDEGDEPICSHSCSQEGPAAATVTVSDSGAKEGGAGVNYSWVTVYAVDDVTGVEIKRGIRVSVAVQGLQVTKGLNEDGTVHVIANGKETEKLVTFKLIAYDAESKQLVSEERYLEDLDYVLDHEPKTPEFNVVAYCGLIHDCKLVYAGAPLTADYTYKTQKELPGEDRIVVNYTVSVPGLTGDEYTRRLPVTLEVMTLEQESEAKEIEYERCRETIRKYIPADLQQKFYTLVDGKKDKLGPKGLAKLRRKIWSIAVNYILAEGDEAYKEMEKWADRIVTVLEYAEAAGDIAFNAAAAAFLGPYGAMGAGFIKGALISAVQAHEAGQDIMTWASQNLDSLYFIAEGQVIDVDVFEKALGGNRYKAWAYYAAMTFVLKLYRQKEVDFYQAAKDTVQDLALEKFSTWLGQETAKSLNKHGIKYTGKGGDTVIVKPTGDGGDGPGFKPSDAPPKQPDGPPKQPDGPPKDPDGPPKQPHGPPKEPDGPPKQPDGPPKEPDGPPKQPDGPPKDPDGPPKQPDGPPKEPDGQPKQPDGPPKDPDGPPKQPDGPPKDPDGPPKPPDGPPKEPDGPPKQPDGPDDGVVPPLKPPGVDGPSKPVKPTGDGPPKQPDGPGRKPDDPGKKPDQPAKKPDEGPKKEKPESPEAKKEREARNDAWKKGQEAGKQKVDDFHKAVEGGDPEKIKQAALDIQKDKQALYDFNRRTGPEADAAKQKMNDALKQVYKDADDKTKDRLATEYNKQVDAYNQKAIEHNKHLKPGEKTRPLLQKIKPGEIEVVNPTNKKPDAPPSVPADRDVTMRRPAQRGEMVTDPDAPGGFRQSRPGDMVDITSKELKQAYDQSFYEAAGGKERGYDDPAKFAKDMDQTPTDRLSADAYGRFPKDLETATKNPAGEFTDPQQVGQASAYKANEWYAQANEARHGPNADPAKAEGCMAEGMRQTTKQYDNQVGKRLDHLESKGINVEPPKKLADAMGEMNKVKAGTMSPADCEKALKNLGYDSPHDVSRDLGDFITTIYKMGN